MNEKFAFPSTRVPGSRDGQSIPFGLTKREWMAGMIASGYVANKDRPQHFQPEDDAAWILRLTDLLLKKANS